jgi:hypothetical protein
MASSTQSAGAIVSAITFPFWSSLPVELKEIVLQQHLVPRKQPMTARMHNLMYGPLLCKLSSVGKEMHQLAVKTYYRCNTFEVSPRSWAPRPKLGSASPLLPLVITCIMLSFMSSSQALSDILTVAMASSNKTIPSARVDIKMQPPTFA